MELRVSSAARAVMLAAAARAGAEECCGLLWGTPGDAPRITRAEPCANVADDRRRRFEIDPAALIAAHRAMRAAEGPGGAETLLGYYHSHPTGPAVPSTTDRAQAAHDGRIWAIIALAADPPVTFWRDECNDFVAIAAMEG